MKRIFSKLKIFILAIMLIIPFVGVEAAGNATFNINGNSEVAEGSNVTYTVTLTNLSAPILTYQAEVEYNSTYLQFVSAEPVAMSSSYTDASKMLLGFTMSAVQTDQTLVKLTFKALKTGSTSIGLKNTEVSDQNSAILTSNNPTKNVTITAPKSTDNNLKSLSVTGCTISPAFSSGTTNYSCTVANSVTSVNVSAVANDSKATITSGTGSKSLNVGANTINVVVKSESGASKTYKITVTRQSDGSGTTPTKSNDATLKGLTVSGYTLSPAFNSGTTSYSVTVPNSASEVIVNATPNHAKASASVSGNTNLSVGNNSVTVTVTAEDGTKKTYTITVTKQASSNEPVVSTKSSDATLKSLSISGYTLKPKFNKNTTVYSINVANGVTGLNVTATPNSDAAKVVVSGNRGWKVGANIVTIKVTAEDGSQNTYIVNVNRAGASTDSASSAKSSDNYLSSLIVKNGTLSPKFDKNVSNYSINVPYETAKLDITYDKSNSNANVKIIGNEELLVGAVSTVQVEVTAEDGSIRIYTINATRSSVSGNVDIKSLSVDGYKLSPSFDPEITTYKVKVNSNTDKLDLTVVLENSSSKYEITGNENFTYGNNVVLIKVTDTNGFSKYYQINVEKSEPGKVAGLSIGHFLMLIFIIMALIALIILVILLLKKKNRNENKKVAKDESAPAQPLQVPFTVNFNPEINVASKKESDDDVVYDNGILNQGRGGVTADRPKLGSKLFDDDDVIDAEVYDIYDDKVTKDELYDAIEEANNLNDASKLKILLEQERLNREKQKMKEEEEKKKSLFRSDRYE